MMVFKGYHINICFGLLIRFGCSIVSDVSLSDLGSLDIISWLLSSPFLDLKYIVVWVFFLQLLIQIRDRSQNLNCHY